MKMRVQHYHQALDRHKANLRMITRLKPLKSLDPVCFSPLFFALRATILSYRDGQGRSFKAELLRKKISRMCSNILHTFNLLPLK
jgi:hypothetical protein